MKKLLLTIILCLMCSFGYTAEYAWYKCDDDAANTTVTDDGSGSNNGVANVNTSNYSVVGKIDDAFEFNGSSEYVNLDALEADIGSDTTGSITFWVNPDTGANGPVLNVADKDAPSSEFYLGVVAGSNMELIIDIGASEDLIYLGPSISANTWTHIAITQDGSQLRIYKNGSEISPTKSDDTDPGAWFDDVPLSDVARVGCRNYNGGGNTTFLDGRIDDFRYFQNDALTAGEVLAIYEEGEPPSRRIMIVQ